MELLAGVTNFSKSLLAGISTWWSYLQELLDGVSTWWSYLMEFYLMELLDGATWWSYLMELYLMELLDGATWWSYLQELLEGHEVSAKHKKKRYTLIGATASHRRCRLLQLAVAFNITWNDATVAIARGRSTFLVFISVLAVELPNGWFKGVLLSVRDSPRFLWMGTTGRHDSSVPVCCSLRSELLETVFLHTARCVVCGGDKFKCVLN